MPFTNRTSAISGHDEKSDKPHKYVKPRIGSQFQVDILPYVRPSDSVTQSASETETFRSETSAPVFRAAPPLKKRGRPPKNKAGECFHGLYHYSHRFGQFHESSINAPYRKLRTVFFAVRISGDRFL